MLLTFRGEPVAVISPVERGAIEKAIELEAQRAEKETLGWLALSESAFPFWENEENEVWDEVAEGAEG